MDVFCHVPQAAHSTVGTVFSQSEVNRSPLLSRRQDSTCCRPASQSLSLPRGMALPLGMLPLSRALSASLGPITGTAFTCPSLLPGRFRAGNPIRFHQGRDLEPPGTVYRNPLTKGQSSTVLATERDSPLLWNKKRTWCTRGVSEGAEAQEGNGSAVRRGRYSLSRSRKGGELYERPRRIILVRHGESEGNVDEAAYTRIADSRIALTQKGWEQAKECGKQIRELIEGDGEEDWKVYFYVSPYKRTVQTLRGLGLAFERSRIAGVREEPRIREQDFGNFQCRERMRVEKEVRLRYGRFFYRFPDGESAADVYDRVTGFRETLRADIEIGRFQRPDFTSRNMNLVIVSHGLTLRVFLMRWFKWTVKEFEGLYNLGNASMTVMERGKGGRYSLRVQHSREELQGFGMTEEMIRDQEWQLDAYPGDLNSEWITSGPSFFDHFDDDDSILHDYVCEGLSDGCVPNELPSLPVKCE